MALKAPKTKRTLSLVALAVFVAPGGCSDSAPDRSSASAEAFVESRSDHGRGTVAAVDVGAGTVTIEHGAMPEMGWSAMTMTFAADPGLLAGVEAGDRVVFNVTVSGNRGTVTALRPE